MISICIATFNGEKYIKQQIDSILCQLTRTDEIVVSDDCSTDETLTIIKNINSPIIKIYTNKGEHGYTPNFENAIGHSTGDYIFLSDQDDIWEKDKVKIMMESLKTNDFVVSDAKIVDKDLNTMYKSYYAIRKPNKSLIGALYQFGFLGCCFAFRRNILTRALPFPKNHLKCTHDNWIYLIAKTFFKVSIINQQLILYRRSGDNTSTGGLTNITSFSFKCSYRIYLIYNLIKRS